jgi:hypothetical protein
MSWGLADLANVAVRTTFGQSVTYTPQVGSPYTFRAVRDVVHVQERIGQSKINESTTEIRLTVRLADMDTVPAQGDLLTTQSIDYEVRDVQVDGQGDADLLLIEVL